MNKLCIYTVIIIFSMNNVPEVMMSLLVTG